MSKFMNFHYVVLSRRAVVKESRINMHIKNVMTTVSILHIAMELVNTPTKQPYHIDIFIS